MVGAFSVIVKNDFETDGSFYSTTSDSTRTQTKYFIIHLHLHPSPAQIKFLLPLSALLPNTKFYKSTSPGCDFKQMCGNEGKQKRFRDWQIPAVLL